MILDRSHLGFTDIFSLVQFQRSERDSCTGACKNYLKALVGLNSPFGKGFITEIISSKARADDKDE
jgi:hypothetical protein